MLSIYIKERAVQLMEVKCVEKWKLINEFSFVYPYLENSMGITVINEHVDIIVTTR